MGNYGDVYVFFLYIQFEEWFIGYDFVGIYIFVVGVNNFEIFRVFQFYFFGYFQGSCCSCYGIVINGFVVVFVVNGVLFSGQFGYRYVLFFGSCFYKYMLGGSIGSMEVFLVLMDGLVVVCYLMGEFFGIQFGLFYYDFLLVDIEFFSYDYGYRGFYILADFWIG